MKILPNALSVNYRIGGHTETSLMFIFSENGKSKNYQRILAEVILANDIFAEDMKLSI